MGDSLANGWRRLGPAIAFMVLLGACTTTTITPELVQPAPREMIDTVVVAAGAVPPSAVVISGKLTEIDKGSTAARWIIGFGAGRAIARGTFEIKDTDGVTLARFEGRKAYSGGAGIGGANFLDMDDLV